MNEANQVCESYSQVLQDLSQKNLFIYRNLLPEGMSDCKSFLVVLLLIIPVSQDAHAVVWDGGAGNSDFNNRFNWSSNRAPTFTNDGNNPGFETPFFVDQSATALLSADLRTVGLYVQDGSDVNVGTGTNVLTLSDYTNTNWFNVFVDDNSTLNFTGNLRGDINDLNVFVETGSELVISGTISHDDNLNLRYTGGGDIELQSVAVTSFNSTVVEGNSNLLLTGASNLQSSVTVDSGSSLNGDGTITGDLDLRGTLSPGNGGSGTLSVGGDLNNQDFVNSGAGTWVFDAIDSANRDFVSVGGNLDVGVFDLNLVGLTSGSASASAPIILAEYGSLSGVQFASVTGLVGNQRLVYDFGINSNQIAIVPEATLILPLALSFLPIFLFRRRSDNPALVGRSFRFLNSGI